MIVLVIRGRPVYDNCHPLKIKAKAKDELESSLSVWPGSDKGILKGKDES